MSMMRTFDDWSNAGFMIKKGSKAKMRDQRGTPLFDSDQVTKKPTSSKRRYMPEPVDYAFPDDDIPF